MKLFLKLISYIVLVFAVTLLLVSEESLRIGINSLNKLSHSDIKNEIIEYQDLEEKEDDFQDAEISEDLEPETVIVKRVIDGDTIELNDERIIRFIGINTPEKYQVFGAEVTAKTKEFILGKEVNLEYDKGRYDKYGRVLAYVYTEDCFINYELIRGGFASLMMIPPNTKYLNKFKEAQLKAKTEKLGIWKENK